MMSKLKIEMINANVAIIIKIYNNWVLCVIREKQFGPDVLS